MKARRKAQTRLVQIHNKSATNLQQIEPMEFETNDNARFTPPTPTRRGGDVN